MRHEVGDFAAEKMHEECGVFGIYAPSSDVAQLTYYGLYALQHRGQESAGIAISDGKNIKCEKGMGLVAEVFQDNKFKQLQGQLAVGHVLYAAKDIGLISAQPLVIRYRNGHLAIAHNGNLINGTQLRSQLEEEGTIFQTTADSEIIAHLIARSGETDIVKAIKKSLSSLRGAYTYIMMTPDRLGCPGPPRYSTIIFRKDGAWLCA